MNFWMILQARKTLYVGELIADIRSGKMLEDRVSLTAYSGQFKAGDKGFMTTGEVSRRTVYATFTVVEGVGEPMLDPHPEYLVNPEEDTEKKRALIRYDSCFLIPPKELKRVKTKELKMPLGRRKVCKIGEDLYERVREEIARRESPPPRKD